MVLIQEKPIICTFFRVNQTVFKTGVYYSGVKIFNSLPLAVKAISHDHKKFKSRLKKFLYSYSFYILEEFFLTELTN